MILWAFYSFYNCEGKDEFDDIAQKPHRNHYDYQEWYDEGYYGYNGFKKNNTASYSSNTQVSKEYQKIIKRFKKNFNITINK